MSHKWQHNCDGEIAIFQATWLACQMTLKINGAQEEYDIANLP